MAEITLSSVIGSASVPLLVAVAGGIIGWQLKRLDNIWARRMQNRNEKAQRYTALVESLRGFTVGAHAQDMQEARRLKETFLNQLNVAWLYCPDDVIKLAYQFIDMVHTDRVSPATDAEKEAKVGELMVEIRKDMLRVEFPRETSFTAQDFRLMRAT